MDMFMLTTVAYIGIVMELVMQLLILSIGIATIRLINAKARQLRSKAAWSENSEGSKSSPKVKDDK